MDTESNKKIIKHLIDQCSPKAQRNFKLAFGRNGGKRSVEDAEKLDIKECVDLMSEDQINPAIDLLNRTLKKEVSIPSVSFFDN